MEERTVRWKGDSRDAVRAFPERVRWIFGRALHKAQLGKRHRISSPLKGSLRGIVELAADERGDTFRLYYTLKCSGTVYVLYCHKKKSKRGIGIPTRERALIMQRFRQAMLECAETEVR